MSMINEADVIKSLMARLMAVSGASWNVDVGGETARVYSAGGTLDNKVRPFLVVGCFDSTNELVETPDIVRLEEYLVFITCIAATEGQMDKYELSGEVKNSLINSDIDIKDFSGESPVVVYSDILRNIDITDQVHESISQIMARSAREINGTLSAYLNIA